MTNQSLENLYREIFKEVYHKIKNQNRGVVYQVIHIILEEEKSQARFICDEFDIRDSASLDNDKKIVENLVSNQKIWDKFNPIKSLEKFGRSNHLEEQNMELFWLVLIACMLVGVYSCLKYLEKNTKQPVGGNTRSLRPAPLPPQPITAALCLVIPASAAGDLIKDSPINVSKIENIIDAASYFLCTKVEDADLKQQNLELTDENIATVGEYREVYIRINIADGQELIGKKVLYSLKKNLPSKGQGVVRQLACLKNLSGLENFNRV